jgi:ferrous-iron efflux pump FieF
MDARLGEEETWIRRHIAELKPTVRGFHKLRSRRSGPTRFVDVHVLMDGGMQLDRAHEISQRIEDAVEARFPGTSLTVHMEPCDAECAPPCVQDCLLDSQERRSLGGR